MIDHLSSKDCAAAGTACPAIQAGMKASAKNCEARIAHLKVKFESPESMRCRQGAFLNHAGFMPQTVRRYTPIARDRRERTSGSRASSIVSGALSS
jgi:hypothetical protein